MSAPGPRRRSGRRSSARSMRRWTRRVLLCGGKPAARRVGTQPSQSAAMYVRGWPPSTRRCSGRSPPSPLRGRRQMVNLATGKPSPRARAERVDPRPAKGVRDRPPGSPRAPAYVETRGRLDPDRHSGGTKKSGGDGPASPSAAGIRVHEHPTYWVGPATMGRGGQGRPGRRRAPLWARRVRPAQSCRRSEQAQVSGRCVGRTEGLLSLPLDGDHRHL